ncbi:MULTISPECIES: DUF2188 domain-containing protein [Cupriavidus]|uniref:DUF2188 domain-containing protein n=1 Tax=Cupriavidus TaxID=106589 RepID=UPI000CE05177|nr:MULTISPECIES: DUF2188 domain-containing protein [Cupriavidus]AVA33695.1 hypothetical protein C3Z06_08630 [Cupriavidus metallidurans]KAB0594536.1 DUF2188 domain-containing protein [Cupriavidus pauculus]UAL03922.1 DUF2188 domain-containing protein [Cupriavidus pauculus]
MSGDIHVVPHQGKWAIAIEGTGVRTLYETQAAALVVAKEMAKISRVELIIYSGDGKIQERKRHGYTH